MTNNFNFTSMDRLNSITATALQTAKGEVLTVTGMLVEQRPDENGVIRTYGYIKTADSTYYTTVSETVIRGIDALIDYAADEGINEIKVKVSTQLSKNDREFYFLAVID